MEPNISCRVVSPRRSIGTIDARADAMTEHSSATEVTARTGIPDAMKRWSTANRYVDTRGRDDQFIVFGTAIPLIAGCLDSDPGEGFRASFFDGFGFSSPVAWPVAGLR